jgi:hypothetical protein
VRTQLQHNTAEIRRRMLARAPRVERELIRENTQIADLLTKASKQELEQDVYSKPADQPRSRQLIDNDEFVSDGLNLHHSNPVPHYIKRWRYGKPGGQPAKPPKIASSWHRTAVIKNARAIAKRRRAAIARGWGRAL